MTLMIDRLDFKRLKCEQDLHDDPAGDLLGAHTPAFEITNVADLCYRMDLFDKIGRDIRLRPEKFPNVAPPYRSYWMEWRPPPNLDERKLIGKFGLWCAVTDDTDDECWRLVCNIFVNARRPIPTGHFALTVGRDGTVIDPGRLTVFPDVAQYLLDLDIERETRPEPHPRDERDEEIAAEYAAKMSGMSEDERAVFSKTELAVLEERQAEATVKIADLEQRTAEIVGDAIRIGVLPPLLLAHSLLGCRNVDTETVRPSPKVSRAAEKRRGRGLVTFKTLTIKPMGGSHAPAQRVEIGGGQTALHLVRGHFKTFTAERPLFGSRIGTYWWSPNVRGNAEQGVVVKDYKVEA